MVLGVGDDGLNGVDGGHDRCRRQERGGIGIVWSSWGGWGRRGKRVKLREKPGGFSGRS